MASSFRSSSEGFSDEDSSEEIDEEVEPKLKYERLGNGVSNILKKDTVSCLAVHAKFIALGTKWGLIYIMDHSGNIIDKKISFNMHITQVNQISIDHNGEYLASCSEDGNVLINGLYTSEYNQTVSFDRPVRSVVIEPQYAKQNKQFITGHNQIMLYEKAFLGRLKSTPLAPIDSCIHIITWKGSLVAWAVDRGVYVYDLTLKKIIRFVPRPKTDPKFSCGTTPGEKHQRQRYVLNWVDATTLVIAKDNIMMVCVLKDLGKETVSKQADVVRVFDFCISGLCLYSEVLVILSFHSQQHDSLCEPVEFKRPHLRIVEKTTGDELSNDALSIRGFQAYTPLDYQLEHYSEEDIFFVVSAKDVVLARQREPDDHVLWLIEHLRFCEALTYAKENSKFLKKITVQEVGFHWFNNLYNDNRFEEAAKICANILGRSKDLWQSYVVRFEQVDQLECLTPYLPTTDPRLDPDVYERILEYFLHNNQSMFQSQLRQWSHPDCLFNVELMLHLSLEKLEEDRDNVELLEALAFLYSLAGNFKKALYIFIKLGHKDVFKLIASHDLFDVVSSQLTTLITFDPQATVELLLNNIDRIPVSDVVKQLDNSYTSIHLHSYLKALFIKDTHLGRHHHQRQVELYADHEPDKLLTFLKSNCDVSLQQSYLICQQRGLVKEMVYLLDVMGNRREALKLTLTEGVGAGVDFCKQHNDVDLWKMLVDHSIDKPEDISTLLQTAGGHMDPVLLVSQIKPHMSIRGLRDSLVKILQDFNQQMAMQKTCSSLMYKDHVSLLHSMLKVHRKAWKIDDGTVCLECRVSVLKDSPAFISFFCQHTFHTDCLIHKDVTTCPVCNEVSDNKYKMTLAM